MKAKESEVTTGTRCSPASPSCCSPVHLVHRGLLAALEAAVVAVVVVEQRLASGGSAYHVPELADGAAGARVGMPGAPACRGRGETLL